jgi:AGZA family xanthine/uracil permease-like MFS transporter
MSTASEKTPLRAGHSATSEFDDTSSSRQGFSLAGAASSGSSSFTAKLEEYFTIPQRGSTVTTEIRSGVVTFFTMAYILVVNAEILHLAGMDFSSVLVATGLTSALACLIVGFFGNLPFGLAPGMGLNSYFTYGVVLKLGLSWNIALTCCFFMGVLFLLLSVTGACTAIQVYAPDCIKKAITVGLGIFQALIGFEMMKLIVPGANTLLETGDVLAPSVVFSVLGLFIICVFMVIRLEGAMIAGIAATTALAWSFGVVPGPTSFVDTPSVASTAFALDFAGFFANYYHTVPITLILLFVAVFDTAGVHFALGMQSGLLEDGHLEGSTTAFTAASVATIAGSVLGSSPIIIHTESCSGIQDGARTGLNAVVIGLCFLLALPFAPVIAAVPSFATAGPLLVVGMLMMGAVKFIDWLRVDEAFPAFATITVLPLTYSIANGMGAGVLFYALLKPAGVWAERRAAQQAARAATPAAAAAALHDGMSRLSPFLTGAPKDDPFRAADEYALAHRSGKPSPYHPSFGGAAVEPVVSGLGGHAGNNAAAYYH